MISVSEAKKIINENVSVLKPVVLPIQQSAGLILAEDIHSSFDIPAFPQSSMDGYAFSFDDWKNKKKINITGEVAAGSDKEFILGSGSAVRIFTGAAVPPGADTVVMQEKVQIENGELKIENETILPGKNVRPKGSEINAGDLALKEGAFLSPAAIGFLAGIGISKVKIYPNPSISIIITGNELQEPGESLNYGQVYESNSFGLKAVLSQYHIEVVEVYYATDQSEILISVLEKALEKSDLVLLTGGVSVGDYDLVLDATTRCNVQKLFHKIKQRPGKPLYFGKKESKLVFGLPGNPSSVLTCFYQYVLPAIEILSKRKISLKSIQVPLATDFQKAAGLTHFLKGIYNGTTLTPLDAQESFRLSSFAHANCLIKIDEEVSACKEGEIVTAYLLPV